MRLYNSFKLIFLSVATATSMASCHSHSEAEHAEEAHEHEHGHNHGADEIVLEPHDAERLGIEADTVRPTTFIETLKVSGEVMPSVTDMGTVSAPTSGIIRFNSNVNPGMKVSAGQALAVITAKNISGGDSNNAARVALDNAKRELDRVTPLLEDGLITKKDYNEALAAYESAKAAYSPTAASGAATAPISGVITMINAKDGEYVETGQSIATVSANGKLTLRALVPSDKAAFLSNIKGAVMSFHDGRSVDIADYNGRLLSSSPASAGVSTPGYVPVYFSFSGAAPVIPGSATEIYLKGIERANVISLPVEAIVEQMGTTFVFIRKGDHVYMKRPVSLGLSDGRRVEIVSGIEPGETAVVKGATFVRLAEQATVAPEGHSHNH